MGVVLDGSTFMICDYCVIFTVRITIDHKDPMQLYGVYGTMEDAFNAEAKIKDNVSYSIVSAFEIGKNDLKYEYLKG